MAERAWRDRLRATIFEELRGARKDPRPVHTRLAEASALVELVDRGRIESGDPEAMPGEMAEAVAGAILHSLLAAARGESRSPDLLTAELMYIAVLPYLGREVALEELRGLHSA